jgi:predicted permease
MRMIDKARLRWRSLTRRGLADAEAEMEFRFHIDQLLEENIAQGMDPAEARRVALLQMGGIAQIREECRDMRRMNAIDDLWKDLHHALRVLGRTPGFTAVALLTIALGTGANTAIFSIVKAVLLEPLAYHQPDRIVAVQTYWTKAGRPGNISGGDYVDLVAEPSPFTAATRYAGGELPVEIRGHAEFVSAFGVDAGFSDVFQLQPVAGRLITRDEFRTKAPLVLVSEDFAIEHYGDAKRAIGQALNLEQSAMSIVGVLPAGFHFPLNARLWLPMPYESANRTAGNYKAVALLKPGDTAADARVHLGAVGARLQQAFPSTHKNKSFTATPLKDLLVDRSRPTLWLLMGAVGLLLLVACANVANLMLARATARAREMALRAALGARRRRLVRQMLVESALLGVSGGAIGFGLAFACVGALLRFAPSNLPRLGDIRVDMSTLLFNVAVSLVVAVLFGLWPGLRAAHVDVNDVLKRSGARGVHGGRGEWTRGALVSAEVALALVLTLGAGLLFRSFLALNAVDLGYQTEGRLILTASIPARTEAQHLEAGATFERIFAGLRELPGVSAVAGVMGLPTGPYGSDGSYAVKGMNDFVPSQFDRLPHAGFRLSSPGYFAAMGVPLLDGRDFSERDTFEAEPVVIVSANLARQVFGGQSPLGRLIKCGLDRPVWMRVVGIAGDMRNENPATPPAPELYMAYRQHPYMANDLHIVVRARGDLSQLARRAVARIDPGIPLKISTMEQFHSDAIALPRFRTLLLIAFAGVASALAAAGVYGVMSYTAAQRRGEMGVRAALGATPGDLVTVLVANGAKLAAIGVIAGLGIALAAGRFVESMLYGIRPRDPVAIGGAVVLLMFTVLLAAFIPALRASRIDPMLALCEE